MTKLSDRIKCFRADRPDEWLMDEFAREAEKLEKALEKISQLGSICDNFEFCEHESCHDSAGAVLIALGALNNETN